MYSKVLAVFLNEDLRLFLLCKHEIIVNELRNLRFCELTYSLEIRLLDFEYFLMSMLFQ